MRLPANFGCSHEISFLSRLVVSRALTTICQASISTMSSATEAIFDPEALGRWILYIGAPFYSYPHKVFLNHYLGADYETAYAHFRRDHHTGNFDTF